MPSKKTSTTPPKAPIDLPFDQFSRQLIVSKIIDTVIRPIAGAHLSIIDLGGHKGKTREFQPNDKVTILDVYDEQYPDYIKGDATNLKIEDKSYDVAVSFDVFEHIPRSKRKAFIEEALRVSKYGLCLAMPVNNPSGEVSANEVVLNSFFHTLYKEDHPWLQEHIEYEIPNEQEVEEIIKKVGASAKRFNSNRLESWRLLQLAIFLAARDPNIAEETTQLNSWYNQKAQHFDRDITAQSYRKIYFISKDEELVASINPRLEKQIIAVRSKIKLNSLDVFAKVAQIIAKAASRKQESIALLASKVAALEQTIASKDHAITTLESELSHTQEKLDQAGQHEADIEHQLMDTKAELANIRSSRSWRYTAWLRWLSKLGRG